MTPEILSKCLPLAVPQNVQLYIDPINATLDEFQINNNKRIAAFIAQIGNESGSLRFVKENLNYSWPRLRQIFPKYFPTDQVAQQYDRQPVAIANRIYANRMANGPEESGDGYRFSGRGLIQITGRTNYHSCAIGLSKDLLQQPEYLETPEGAARSAGWYFASRGLNELADVGNIIQISKIVNGGVIGLTERLQLYQNALIVLNN